MGEADGQLLFCCQHLLCPSPHHPPSLPLLSLLFLSSLASVRPQLSSAARLSAKVGVPPLSVCPPCCARARPSFPTHSLTDSGVDNPDNDLG